MPKCGHSAYLKSYRAPKKKTTCGFCGRSNPPSKMCKTMKEYCGKNYPICVVCWDRRTSRDLIPLEVKLKQQ
jgi:hypothetical protein